MTQPITPKRMEDWARDLFTGLGISAAQAQCVARNMVWSELAGRPNFGVSRIGVHVKRLDEGVLNATPSPRFERTAASTGMLDGDNAFGHHAGEIAMEQAIGLATETGIGMVTVKASNWYGTGAYFVNLAAERGMAGLALSNSFPKVAAQGGFLPVLGTNPFAFGAPRRNGHHLLVDFSTGALAGSTVRELTASGGRLPEGIAVMPDGQAITDPARIEAGALLPFGGAKGFGVSLMVEILSGVLSGSGFSHSVRSTYKDFSGPSDSGHCMVAIDIARFMPLDAFLARLEMLVELLKNSGPQGAVRLPGEIRWEAIERNRKRGIVIPPAVAAELTQIARRVGLETPFEDPAAMSEVAR